VPDDEQDEQGGAPDEAEQWRRRRRDAADEHAATLDRRRAAETVEARALVDDFVAEARARGLRTSRLKARARSGRGSYRTGLTGWYLKYNGSLAVTEDGGFYIMSAPSSLLSYVTGATLTAGDPPLAVGRGARDGESMPLAELLERRLAAGNDWPSSE
jgi:hypothetical protein